VGQLLLLREVTGRKERELNLQRYETIYHAVDENIYALDGEGRFTMANHKLADAVGYPREELSGKPFEFLLAAEESFPADDPTELHADGGAVEVTIETADETTVPCEAIHTPVTFEGEYQGTVGFLRDISERKRLESELVEVEGKLSTVVQSSPLAVAVLDTDGTIVQWNTTAEELFGWDRADVIGEELPMIPDSIVEEAQEYHDRVVAGEQFTGLEYPMELRDGSRIETSVSIAPHFDTDGDVAGIVLIAEDITERKERQRALQEQNEQLEQFASVVSHDLRNPLNVAQGYLDALRAEFDRHEVEEIDASLDRMSAIIEDLLTLAREGQQIGSTAPEDLETVARDAWSTVDTRKATLAVEETRTLEADAHRLAELFENLFRNAIEHGGETVTVTVGLTETGFFVEDDGPGIPADERDSVIEHGFTTSPEGTGFGLAIVETIAEGHGWSLSVTEGTEGGARFEVVVPEGSTSSTRSVPVDGIDQH
jgi:PAS domain S-box-containing protein